MTSIQAYGQFEVNQDFKTFEYERKVEADDVRVKIEESSICQSDLHTADEGWGKLEHRPYVGGHEIIGTIVEIGENVKGLSLGQRVGVGPFQGSCGTCADCARDFEHMCAQRVFTYNAKDRFGNPTYGGYAEAIVVQGKFAIPIPEGMDSVSAAPLLCAGITVYAPLARDVKKGDKVGIVAIGGLGHLAVMFARAMGCHVTAISRNDAKKDLSLKELGADAFLDMSDESAVAAAMGTFDYVLHTAAFNGNINAQLALVRTGGTLCLVGVPDENFQFTGFYLIGGEKTIKSSLVGSPKSTAEMLAFAHTHGIKPMVSSNPPMCEINDALASMRRGDPRFRIVLHADFD